MPAALPLPDRRATPCRGRPGHGMIAAAVAALGALASPPAHASAPLAVASVQLVAIGPLALDFTTGRGWTFTRDGRHLYVTGLDLFSHESLLAHLVSDPDSGGLSSVGVVRGSSLPGTTVLGNATALSPDERELYVAADSSLAVFRRDALTGELGLVQARDATRLSSSERNALVVTPDGRHLLAAAGDAIAVFPRGADGTLGDPMMYPAGDREVVGELGVSRDGRSVYALHPDFVVHPAFLGENRDAVLVFARDPATGTLVRTQRIADGFDDYVSFGGFHSFALSPDGRDLIVGTGFRGKGAVVTLRLDEAGARVVRARVMWSGPPASLSRALDIAPDGEIMVTGGGNVQKVWVRDGRSGALELVQVVTDGDGDALGDVDTLVFRPDGRFAYALATGERAVTVFRRRCGDGVVEVDEACDDANVSAGDGCDAACRIEPCFQCGGAPSTCAPAAASCDDGNPCTTGDLCTGGRCAGSPAADGAPCDDGNPCTTGDACLAAACTSSGRVACEACSVCDRETAACVGMLGRGCRLRPSVVVGKGERVTPPIGGFRRAAGADVMRVHWTSDGPAADGVGDPTLATGYTVCLLDETDNDYTERQRRRIVARARVPSNAECQGTGCWHRRDAGGFVYRRAKGMPDGVRRLRLAPDRSGGLDVVLRARGGSFDPTRLLPVDPPLTVQILADGGACWQGELKPPKERRPASR